MYKLKKELIKPIIYDDGSKYGKENLLYCSLQKLYYAFVINNQKELYLVGGCVRDLLLGKKPKDYDLCTNATPDEVKEIIQEMGLKSFDSGIKHGTLTIIDSFFDQSYEITTYRIDGKYTDGRHPDEVMFTPSLEEDLKRRDFTINSFAYDLLKQEIIMLDSSFLLDLNLKIIRCVGDANKRFGEDALRMLRSIRFASQLGATIDSDTFNAICNNSKLIINISKERIRDELTKIICSNNPEYLQLLITTGLCKFGVLPEIEPLANCSQKNYYHYTDVLHHTFDVIKGVPSEDVQLRWCALLHDIGKPQSKSIDDLGYEHFYDHALLSVDLATKIMTELKFDNKSSELIINFIRYHDAELDNIKNNTFKKLIIKIGEENFNRYLNLRQADTLAHNLTNSMQLLEAVSKSKERFKQIIIQKDVMTLSKLAINGRDVMSFGLKGKEIGEMLNVLFEIVLSDPNLNTRELLSKEIEKRIQN